MSARSLRGLCHAGLLLLASTLALAGAGCGGGGDSGGKDAFVGPPWPTVMPVLSTDPPLRGLIHARGVIHLHSPYSHDACDGNGLPDGGSGINEVCLARFRAAICDDRLDFAMLTDHKTSFAYFPFDKLLLLDAAAGDTAIMKDGSPMANQMACPGTSFKPLLMVGHEDRLMPVGLEKHAVDAAGSDANEQFYAREDLAQAMTYQQLGAQVLIPHTESRSLETLRMLAPALAGIEVFSLHAMMDGRLRSEFLGLDQAGAVRAFAQFSQEAGAAPDLAFLPAFSPNDNDLGKWAALTAEGIKLAGVSGCDAHENVAAIKLSDGDRVDSYRRMIRWATTHVLVTEVTPAGVKAGIGAGRTLVIFEVYGSPQGFDFHATRAAGGIVEMGGEAAVGDMLEVAPPTVLGVEAGAQPVRTMRLLRATAGGWVEVARSPGAIAFPVTSAGAYRAEVLMTPTHLAPWLGKDPSKYLREVPWIYASPIYVK